MASGIHKRPRRSTRISHPAIRGTVAKDSSLIPALRLKNDFDMVQCEAQCTEREV